MGDRGAILVYFLNSGLMFETYGAWDCYSDVHVLTPIDTCEVKTISATKREAIDIHTSCEEARLDILFSKSQRPNQHFDTEVNHCIALFPGERNHPYLVCSYEIVVRITLMTEYDLGRSYVNVSTIHTLELRV